MATTTTNYGWDIPQSTDLVKDGATAIATLGQDIDTSVYTALGGNKSGLVLLNTTSFSAVTSTSLPANTFTSTYTNYRIIYDLTASASTTVTGRLRASGSDITTANYNSHGIYVGSSAPSSVNSINQTSWGLMGNATSGSYHIFELYAPNTNVAKSLSYNAFSVASGDIISYGLRFSTTTVADSFSLYVGTGTITGSYSVYGYNK